MYATLLTIQYIAILILMGDLIFLINQKANAVQRDLVVLHFSMLITVMAYTAEMQATSMDVMKLCVKIGYIGKPINILMVFFLVLDYLKVDLAVWVKTVMTSIQMFITLLVYTFDSHQLFYTTVKYVDTGLFPHLEKGHGVFYNAYTVALVVYGLATVITCIVSAVKSRGKQRLMLATLAVIVSIPFVGFGLYSSKVTMGYDATVIGYAVASVVFAFLFRNYDVFETVTVATSDVFRHLGVGLIVYDENGVLLHMNNLAEKMRISSRVDALSQMDEPYKYDGALYNIERFEIVDQGVNYGVAYVINDVTSDFNYKKRLQEEKERADEASKAKSQFLSSMSHDIRTPMNAILGMTQVAKIHLDDKQKVSDCLDKVTISGNHLLELINQVLDMNKIESGKYEVSSDSFDLIELFEEIDNMSTPLAEAKNQTYIKNLDGIRHRYVKSDRSKLSQIVMNLLSNAFKYTDFDGRIELTVTESEGDEVSGYTIEVRDNGIGMDEEYLKIIFDPFTRSADERVKKAQGTGLGTAITKQFVELLGGTVSVTSKLGEGSVFTVNIPMTHTKEEEAVTTKKDIRDVAELDLSQKRALLVEDNEFNAELAIEIFSMTGITVDRVADGQEACETLEKAADGYYDIVFMDVNMPRLNGYDATTRIRSWDRQYTKNVPIIAMTADAFADDIQRAKECGMDAHLAKPIDFNKLFMTLTEYCSSSDIA